MNLEAPTSASPIPARLDKWGTVVGTDLIRAPWQGKGVPDIGCRLVQHGDGTVCVYDRNSRLVYSVPSAEVANISFGSTQAFVRKTPSWAIVLGIIGLLFFLLGLLFFLVKENVPYMAATITVTTTTGHSLVFTCA